MDNIKGLNIPKLGFKPLKLGDFLYHEGPLLSHFVDENNPHEHYFYKWSDSDTVCNRWLIAKFSEETLSHFLNQEISLKQVICQNAFIYLLDLDNDLNEQNILVVNTQDLPKSYLPSDDSFYNEKHYENYALNLKESLLNNKDVVFSQVLDELSNIKKQQSETNQLLNVLLKKFYPNEVSYGQVAETEASPYGKKD